MPVFSWELAIHQFIQTLRGTVFIEILSKSVSTLDFALGLLAVIIGFVLATYRKRSFVYLALIFISVVCAHYFGHYVIKSLIHRPRPEFIHAACNTPRCWGFVSSLACDYFAAAGLLFYVDRRHLWWGLPLGLILGFTRMYIGDHFMLDVIAGSLLGFFIATVVWTLYVRLHRAAVKQNTDVSHPEILSNV